MIFRSPFPAPEIPDVPLHELVMRDFASRGDAPALIDAASGRTLGFAQIAAGVRRLAAGLRARGSAKGERFAILLPNVPEYAIAFLGAAAAGAVVVPMSPLLTPKDIHHVLADTGATRLLTLPPFVPAVREAQRGTALAEIYVLGEAPDATPFAALLREDRPLVAIGLDPANDLLVLPYSSGTSGVPKGVMLTHRNVVAQLVQASIAMPPEPGDRAIAVAPFFHILGMVLVLLAGLRAGVSVIAMPRFDLVHFLEAIQKYRVTLAPVVPPIMVALAKHPAVGQYDLSSLRALTSGAAPLGADVEDACAKRIGCRVAQGWGMTEVAGAGITATSTEGRIGSVGWLWPGMEARIVDLASGADLGRGERGELLVRGPNVMRGYLNQPRATADTLLPDGWMRTGDVAYVDDDGFFFVVDRVKELIKYNAYQIAPAELEDVLLSHPGVADAAVIPSADEEHGEVPKAFVVLRSPVPLEDILHWVAERVAPYKKVRRIEAIDAIPKSPSGKILRRVLVERERAQTRA